MIFSLRHDSCGHNVSCRLGLLLIKLPINVNNDLNIYPWNNKGFMIFLMENVFRNLHYLCQQYSQIFFEDFSSPAFFIFSTPVFYFSFISFLRKSCLASKPWQILHNLSVHNVKGVSWIHKTTLTKYSFLWYVMIQFKFIKPTRRSFETYFLL